MQELSLAAIFLGVVIAVITGKEPPHQSSQQPTITQVVNVEKTPQPKNITINVYTTEEDRKDA